MGVSIRPGFDEQGKFRTDQGFCRARQVTKPQWAQEQATAANGMDTIVSRPTYRMASQRSMLRSAIGEIPAANHSTGLSPIGGLVDSCDHQRSLTASCIIVSLVLIKNLGSRVAWNAAIP